MGVRPVSWRDTKDPNECKPLTFGLVPDNVLVVERSRVTELGGQEWSVPPSDPRRRLRLAIDRVVKLDQVLEMAGTSISTVAGRSAARTSETLLALFTNQSQDRLKVCHGSRRTHKEF